MSEIKNVAQTRMAKCNQLTSLPFKALIKEHSLVLLTVFGCCMPTLLGGDLRPTGGEVPCDAVQ